MQREDIEKLAIRQAHYLRNIDIPAVPFYHEQIGFKIKYKNVWLYYYYDDNGEVSIPQDDGLFDVAVKFISEIPDDNIQKSIEKAQRKHIEKAVFGTEQKMGTVKLMSEIFGDEADNFAKRTLTNAEYLEFLKWKINTQNL